MKIFRKTLLLLACAIAAFSTRAEVRLPNLFSSNMVLQREIPVEVWGWADKGERVEVIFDGKTIKTRANDSGKWSVELPALPAGGPYTLEVKGKSNVLLIENVLLGDVWVCSGQSNMEWPVNASNNADEEIAAADYPRIRLFHIPRAARGENQLDIEASWAVCSPQSIPRFSAVGYYFGRKLHTETDVPIGLINTSWGGTRVEPWISPETFRTLPASDRTYYTKLNLDAELPSLRIDEQLTKNVADANRFVADLKLDDRGIAERWYADGYDYSSWNSLDFPQSWSEIDCLKNIDGHLWMSYTIELPASATVPGARLFLGQVDDGDKVWINGIKVGETKNTAPMRDYTIPDGVLRAGRNTIVLRVTDSGGNGGIRSGTPIHLNASGVKYSLTGQWRARLTLSSADYYEKVISPNRYPSILYMAMISPLVRYKIKGAIWYQGESNAAQAFTYRSLFPAMIRDWRARWGYDFPFYWVQLANFMAPDSEPAESAWAELREAQSMTLSVPQTGQAVIIDIGEELDIHPRNKQDVGARLARLALCNDYGRTELVCSGPVYRSMEVRDGEVVLTFDPMGSPLATSNKYGYVQGFTIAGADRVFVWAQARIDGDKIIVSSDRVSTPVAVRYNWGNNPDGTLFNVEGLPASPFRTDAWPGITQ